MEINNTTNWRKNRWKFKSHYVVWKYMAMQELEKYVEEFKSHYVVWKFF